MEPESVFPRYPEYRDSGVEWLGDVPSHWEVKAIKRQYNVVGGSTPKSEEPDFWDGDIQWVTPADIGKLSESYIGESQRKITLAGLQSCSASLVPSGSLIVSTRAPIGSIAIAQRELCFNQGCKALVPMNKTDCTRFCYYVFSTTTQALNTLGKGTTFLELSADALSSFVVPCPSLPEQQAIAAFLDHETAKIDTLIAKQERLIALLAEKRQAVISHAVTKGLNPSAAMKASGVEWLGDVPSHWDVKRIGGVCAERRQKVSDTDFAPLSVTKNGIVPQLETAAKTDDGDNRKLVCIGDFVINSRSDRKGSSGLSNYSGSVSLINTVLNPVGIHGWFTHYLLKSRIFQEEYYRYGKGIVADLWSTNYSEMRNIVIPLPPLPEQQAIAAFLDQETAKIDALIEKAKQSIELMKERRAALISSAVTGKIDVRKVV